MTSTSPPGSSRANTTARSKVQAHRERLRAKGLRPIQLWVPNVSAPSFRAEAHRQSLAVAGRPDTDQDFIDAVSDLNGG